MEAVQQSVPPRDGLRSFELGDSAYGKLLVAHRHQRNQPCTFQSYTRHIRFHSFCTFVSQLFQSLPLTEDEKGGAIKVIELGNW